MRKRKKQGCVTSDLDEGIPSCPLSLNRVDNYSLCFRAGCGRVMVNDRAVSNSFLGANPRRSKDAGDRCGVNLIPSRVNTRFQSSLRIEAGQGAGPGGPRAPRAGESYPRNV